MRSRRGPADIGVAILLDEERVTTHLKRDRIIEGGFTVLKELLLINPMMMNLMCNDMMSDLISSRTGITRATCQ